MFLMGEILEIGPQHRFAIRRRISPEPIAKFTVEAGVEE